MQELCTVILTKTDAVKQLVCSGRRAEDQEEANRRFIYVAAVTRLARELKEIQDSYLCQKVSMCSLPLIHIAYSKHNLCRQMHSLLVAACL